MPRGQLWMFEGRMPSQPVAQLHPGHLGGQGFSLPTTHMAKNWEPPP